MDKEEPSSQDTGDVGVVRMSQELKELSFKAEIGEEASMFVFNNPHYTSNDYL